ncbi:MAG: hypothetical protein HOI95_08885, partial [Chromatiales bacterium]|nr:hypothetical protein [Chromatiales bacterium]
MKVTDEDLWSPLSTMSSRIAQGDISPVALTEAMLARIEALEPKLNAYITVTGDLALEQAARAQREIA